MHYYVETITENAVGISIYGADPGVVQITIAVAIERAAEKSLSTFESPEMKHRVTLASADYKYSTASVSALTNKIQREEFGDYWQAIELRQRFPNSIWCLLTRSAKYWM